MTTATELLARSVKAPFENFRFSLNLALPFGLLTFLISYFSYQLQIKRLETMLATGSAQPGAAILSNLILFVSSVLIGAIFAVAWHRYMLIDDDFGWRPNQIWRPAVGNYIIGVLILFLICVLVSLPLLAGTSIFFSLLTKLSDGLMDLGLIIAFAAIIWFAVFLYRLSPILPARAIEKPLTIGEALKHTKGKSWTILGALILLYIILVVIYFPIARMMNPSLPELQEAMNTGGFEALVEAMRPSFLALLLLSIFGAFMSLIQLSFVTEIYRAFIPQSDSNA